MMRSRLDFQTFQYVLKHRFTNHGNLELVMETFYCIHVYISLKEQRGRKHEQKQNHVYKQVLVCVCGPSSVRVSLYIVL